MIHIMLSFILALHECIFYSKGFKNTIKKNQKCIEQTLIHFWNSLHYFWQFYMAILIARLQFKPPTLPYAKVMREQSLILQQFFPHT